MPGSFFEPVCFRPIDDDFMRGMRNHASEEKAISIAKNLLQIGLLTYEQIAKATELTIAKVQELAGQVAG